MRTTSTIIATCAFAFTAAGARADALVMGLDLSIHPERMPASRSSEPLAPAGDDASASGGDGMSLSPLRVGIHVLRPAGRSRHVWFGASASFGGATTGNSAVAAKRVWRRFDGRARLELSTSRRARSSAHLFAEVGPMLFVRDGAHDVVVGEQVERQQTTLGIAGAVGAGVSYRVTGALRVRLDVIAEAATITLDDGVPAVDGIRTASRNVRHTDLRVMMRLGVEW